MPIILGIYDSPFDSGATLLKDGKILGAIHEERLCRIKHVGGFPKGAIKEVLNITNINSNEIDAIAVGCINQNFIVQLIQGYSKIKTNYNPLKSKFDKYFLYIFELYEKFIKKPIIGKINALSSDSYLYHMLNKLNIKKKFIRFDHHLCHAASAFYSSGFKKCLIITADARGNGISTSINIANKNGIQRIAISPESASMGHFYGGITELLNFGYGDGEGKTEALAAFGKYSKAYNKLKGYIEVKKLKLEGKMNPYQRIISIPFLKLLKNHKKENIAFAAQKILEETYITLIKNAIEETGIVNIALAGGVFLNVKLNQRIMELPEVKQIFIHPAAGDSGISTGAAFLLYSKKYGLNPKQWRHVFLGNSFSNDRVEKALINTDLEYDYIADIDTYVGEELLPKNYLVGWFKNRMEYGPRALGARSVLIDPRNPKSPSIIRSSIKKRPMFQPFCPSLLKEEESKYIDNPKNVNAPFMIITFNAKQRMIDEAPAVVFIDSSVRIQSVEKEYNKDFYNVIKAFNKETGVPIVLNTSFNMSGDPIVCTPEDAIKTFIKSKLDFLAIENYLVKKKN